MADRRLQVFHAVARHLSVIGAAEQLGMTPEAVTYRVRQFEDHLNTRLYRRIDGRIILTPAGTLVFDYAARILDLTESLEAAVGELTGAVSGTLLLGASATLAEFYLPHILGEFRVIFPNVQVHMAVANSETILSRVADQSVDLGLISMGHPHPAQKSVCIEEVCEDVMLMVCAPGHRMAGAIRAEAGEVATEPFVSREPGSGTREVTDRYFQANGIAPDEVNVVMELGSPEAIKGVVETGLGISILSRATLVKELKLGILRALPLNPPLTRRLYMVTLQDRPRSRLHTTFIDFANNRLRSIAAAR